MTDRGQQDIGGLFASVGVAGFLGLAFVAADAVLGGWDPALAGVGVVGFVMMAGAIIGHSRLTQADREGET